MKSFLFLLLTFSLPICASPKARFENCGYLWIKDFFSEEEAALVKNWADQIHEETKHNPQTKALIIVPEAKDPTKTCRAEDLLSYCPELSAFINNKVTTFIEALLNEPYVPFKDKINFKWPGGGAFSPHQDFPAFALLPPKSHVNAMLSIDPATIENGCLYIAENWTRGHEILPLIQGGPDHGSIKPSSLEETTWLAFETSPRDLVLFTSFIPHFSEPNMSNTPRRAMFFTFNKLAEGEHKDAYYHAKRHDPENPIFHIGTPTKARGK